jgi:acetyl-CoA acetyltransferase
MPPAEKIVVIDGARAPIGSFGGAFKDVPGYALGSLPAREALSRAAVRAEGVDEVVMGCIGQVGSDAYNARRAALSASGINEGVAAAVIAPKSVAKERGLTPLMSLEAVATAANEPVLMGYAPTFVFRKLFEKTSLASSDIDIVELNEAFASQAVAVIRDAGLDPEKTKPYGGAIALGHSVAATGANLTLRAAKHLACSDGGWGIVTMCISGGRALAALFRRVP